MSGNNLQSLQKLFLDNNAIESTDILQPVVTPNLLTLVLSTNNLQSFDNQNYPNLV